MHGCTGNLQLKDQSHSRCYKNATPSHRQHFASCAGSCLICRYTGFPRLQITDLQKLFNQSPPTGKKRTEFCMLVIFKLALFKRRRRMSSWMRSMFDSLLHGITMSQHIHPITPPSNHPRSPPLCDMTYPKAGRSSLNPSLSTDWTWGKFTAGLKHRVVCVWSRCSDRIIGCCRRTGSRHGQRAKKNWDPWSLP